MKWKQRGLNLTKSLRGWLLNLKYRRTRKRKSEKKNQLEFNFGPEPIETIFISPTKEMPLDVFKAFHRLAYYTELMDRVQDQSHFILWDSARESIYSESSAEAEWQMLQEDMLQIGFEVPKKAFGQFMSD